MNDSVADGVVFLTVVRSVEQEAGARLLVESIRAFGGTLSECPIWVFAGEGHAIPGTETLALSVPEAVTDYPFAAKVWACSRAEKLVDNRVQSLIWMGPDCLVIQPPVLLALDERHDAAVRPVHIRNVGLAATGSVDRFWARVYESVGAEDVALTVESFVDQQRLRAYVNSHIISVRPALGIYRRWFELFASLVDDSTFQTGACSDPLHQIFLHQAVLSTLLATGVGPGRLRILPPAYSYPYNLQDRVPPHRRATALNDLVCVAYEDRPLHPDEVGDIDIREPLWSWLAARISRPH